jgi:hypothetical protein
MGRKARSHPEIERLLSRAQNCVRLNRLLLEEMKSMTETVLFNTWHRLDTFRHTEMEYRSLRHERTTLRQQKE